MNTSSLFHYPQGLDYTNLRILTLNGIVDEYNLQQEDIEVFIKILEFRKQPLNISVNPAVFPEIENIELDGKE